MVVRYRLQYINSNNALLSIKRPYEEVNYMPGDCRVQATEENGTHTHLKKAFTEPMTIDEIREYLLKNHGLLGPSRDCIGLSLDNSGRNIAFDEAIQVRTFLNA
jgi:hypothetical protein